MKARIIIIYLGICFLWGVLILRAAYLQFIPHNQLSALQNKQFQTVVKLPPRRGAILDRDGKDLAMSQPAYSIYADPKIIADKKEVANELAKVLKTTTAEQIFKKIKDKDKRFVWIERKIDHDKAQIIKDYKIKGIGFIEEWKRIYPNENLFSQALGFVGKDGPALEGLEKQYEEFLRGNEKKVVVRKDARGRPLITNDLIFSENSEGHELRLTVDSELQYELENELMSAVKNLDADSAMGIILDANTSAIRAMASLPSYDANKFSKTEPQLRRNRIVTDVIEPGSTMKTIVVATALKNKIAKPNTKFYCEKGSFKVGKHIIREAESHEVFENLTMTEILAVSSNIGTTKIGFKIGDDLMRKSMLEFGFGAKTGVDLPGESKGVVQSLPWRPHLLSNISFGHGISSTPLQMANAYAAIVNGGKLNKPFLVESMRDLDTGKITTTEPELIREVLTAEESMNMRMMLSAVTATGGTGTKARVNGFVVGGKTGTAQKVNPHGKGYLPGAYLSSFAGFIPAANPKFVIYILVDHPKKEYYGSQVAAPIFSRLASFAVRKEGLSPQVLADNAQMPEDLRNIASQTEQAKSKLKKSKKTSTQLTKKQLVEINEQVVQGNITLKELPKVSNVQNTNKQDTKKTEVNLELTVDLVPNYLNLTVREVLQRAKKDQLKIKIHGQSGVVKEMLPSPGEALPEDKQLNVFLN